MSTPTKNESPEPPSMKSELLDDVALTPGDATSTSADASESSQSASQALAGRRPRNPFILFRTWYIKQGHLKQVTSSGSELSKITGKLWKAMHEDDRKFWAEQARQEREASLGRTYTPPTPSKSRATRPPRKKASMASNARYCPMTARAHDPVDERMDDIVQLIIAGKTGDEIGGELRKKKPSVSVSQPLATSSIMATSLPLLAPVPRSARASVSLDALELQSHLSRAQLEQGNTGSSLSPNASLHDLPATPEQSLMSGYHTPYDIQHSYSGTLNLDQSLPLDQTPDFSFNAPSLSDRSGSIDAETWSLAETPSASCAFQPHPTPDSHKEYPELPQLGYPQGWEYYNTPTPVYTLNSPAASFDVPGNPNYTSHSLVPSASWHGPDSVSAYDVPGHTLTAHTGDLAWPSEWVNDSY